MSEDILKRIVDLRRSDMKRLGPTFGVEIPPSRTRGHVEFLGRAGAILEVKRASPSKGDISPNLVPGELAKVYAAAGAQAISVLTERNFFKGSLEDLMEVAATAPTCAVLRKDFLLEEEELEIAYRAGADAVLLIARILDDKKLLRMAAFARELGMEPLIEVRTHDDLRKLALAAKEGKVVSGVNTRDLATFKIDPLVPAALRSKLPGKAIFESGVKNEADAAFARSLGFDGILVGEAVARNPKLAASLVAAFEGAAETARGKFWRQFAELKSRKQGPVVKMCGFTRTEDALAAQKLGADMLGFVFARSKRLTTADFVRSLRALPEFSGKSPLFVGVITDPDSEEGKTALALAEEGSLDAVQFHGIKVPSFTEPLPYACFSAVRVGSGEDGKVCEELWHQGEPRVLLDAKVEGLAGGTGTRIPPSVLREVAAGKPLWLAGGVSPENIGQIMREFAPEFVDVSSGIETSPGVKSVEKMQEFFKGTSL